MTIAEQSVDYEGFCVETKPDQGPVSTLTLNSPHSNLTYTCRELTPQCIYLSFANTAVNLRLGECPPEAPWVYILGTQYIHRRLQYVKLGTGFFFSLTLYITQYIDRRSYAYGHIRVAAAGHSASRWYGNYHSPIGVPELVPSRQPWPNLP